jgi:hypothetical protein
MADEIAQHDTGQRTGMPRWVKVSLIVVGMLIVLFVVFNLTGIGGQHSPGRHLGPGGGDSPIPSSGVAGHRPPAGVQHGP